MAASRGSPQVTQAGALARIVTALDAAGIPHMVAGSVASSFHGEPRTTQDIDLIVDPTPVSLGILLRSLPADRFYVSPEAARDALERRGQFNVIDLESGWKVDLILRKDRPFSRAELERRRPATILGVPVFVATAEDTILAKLEWARLGESERQLRDVAGILGMTGDALDRSYVERWVAVLGLDGEWRRAGELVSSSFRG